MIRWTRPESSSQPSALDSRASRAFEPRAWLRTAAGCCLGLVLRLWACTWRLIRAGDGLPLLRSGSENASGPLVFAFFHGHQMALLRARGPWSVSVMVSHSRDGDLQTGILRSLGLDVVRGSSSRGGSVALRRLVRRLRGSHAGFAVDGPRGPVGLAKPGAALAAAVGGATLVPVAAASSHRRVLGRTWDRFEIPWPFATVAVIVGSPLCARAVLAEPELLTQAIVGARREAEVRVASAGRGVLALGTKPR